MKKDKKLTSSEKIAARTESFFAKNARLLAIIGIIIVVLCVVIAVVSITSNSSRDKIATATYELEQDYYNLLVMDETSDEYNTAASEFIASADAIISEAKTGDYASLKAKYLLGLYYYDAEDWANALSYFEQVVNEGGDTYLVSLSMMNAAASAENAGDTDTALSYYNRVWDTYAAEAPESPKALFNSARIYEQTGNTELAVATYSQLRDEFTTSEYAALAEARLLILE